jgi:hypothetical protein
MLRQQLYALAQALFSTLAVLVMLPAAPLAAEGSVTLYPADASAPYRANLEWRSATYGSTDSPRFNLLRRTLLKLYAEEGEYILLGSSGVGAGGTPNSGDIRVFVPGEVRGPIGREAIPELSGAASPAQSGAFANGFSCVAQRAAAGDGRGRIASRAAELAGPNTSTNLRPTGYAPCIYRAPARGIYDVVFTGPSGASSNTEPQISGQLEPTAADFGPLQQTSVTAWDVTVRADLGRTVSEHGRLFLYYMTGNTGGGGRTVGGIGYVVTPYGFIYRVSYGGDPYGYIVYANQFGFQDSDGLPLYHDVMAEPSAATQDQNELRELQGGVQLLPPEYPIFFDQPDGPALDALGISRTPVVSSVAGLQFAGVAGGIVVAVGEGGSFSFTTNQPGVYSIVISQDGMDFLPTQPRNRLLRSVAAAAGPVTVRWDGLDNAGAPFAPGSYQARLRVQGGEAHFPFLDVENNRPGGPVIELVNPPDTNGDGVGDCPLRSGGCFGAFYDDTGYRTAGQTLVGTAVNGPLCPAGVGGPPQILASDVLNGYDTRTGQRSFGFPYDANPASICRPDGGFGDKKGMDLWTFYPSNLLEAPLRIVAPPLAVTLLDFRAGVEGGQVIVRWSTGGERNTVGFHLLRSASGVRAEAVTVTDALILSRGSAATGASYQWADPATRPGDAATYWLQEIERSGVVNEYGPAQRGPGAQAEGRFTIWLPMLQGDRVPTLGP